MDLNLCKMEASSFSHPTGLLPKTQCTVLIKPPMWNSAQLKISRPKTYSRWMLCALRKFQLNNLRLVSLASVIHGYLFNSSHMWAFWLNYTVSSKSVVMSQRCKELQERTWTTTSSSRKHPGVSSEQKASSKLVGSSLSSNWAQRSRLGVTKFALVGSATQIWGFGLVSPEEACSQDLDGITIAMHPTVQGKTCRRRCHKWITIQ